MRIWRAWTAVWVVALAAAVLAPATAQAHPPSGAGRVVPPHVRFDGVSGGEAMGQGWFLALSSATGSQRCVPFGMVGEGAARAR